MKKLLITGASGFVGNNLIRYCKTNGLNTAELNLRRMPVCIQSGTDAVVHLAGKAHDLKNVSDPSEYFTVNTELTKKLFDLFLLSEASVFVFLSSVKASADKVDGVLTEDRLPNPTTPYGRSKLLAEEYLLSKTLPVSKRLYILRPCMIHGPGNKGNLNLLYRLVKKGIPYPLGAFHNKRSFLGIDNLCFVIKEMVERDDIMQGIYNVADDLPLSTIDILQIIGEELNRKTRVLLINKSLIKTIARIGDIIHLPLNTTRLEKLTENYIVCTKKIKVAMQKNFPFKVDEGLRISIRSFMEDNKY